MASKLTLYEQETIINFNRESKEATVYTADIVVMRHMDKLCEEQPDVFQLTDVYYYQGTDEVCSKSYLIQDKKRIKITKKREFTEEQLQGLRERGQWLFSMKQNKNNSEEESEEILGEDAD